MRKKKIHQGSSKSLYNADEDYNLILSFNDELRLANGQEIEISGKGIINNDISSYIMQKISMLGIDTHFIKKSNMRQQLVQFVDIIPIQVNVCSIACGRYEKDFAIEQGVVFEKPMMDFKVKSRQLGYPAINESQLMSFEILSKREMEEMKAKSIRIYDFLTGLFAGIGIRLVDVNLEFGRVFDSEDNSVLMLADEISPDNCRLWDMETNAKLCYEAAIYNPENAFAAYQEVRKRINQYGKR